MEPSWISEMKSSDLISGEIIITSKLLFAGTANLIVIAHGGGTSSNSKSGF